MNASKTAGQHEDTLPMVVTSEKSPGRILSTTKSRSSLKAAAVVVCMVVLSSLTILRQNIRLGYSISYSRSQLLVVDEATTSKPNSESTVVKMSSRYHQSEETMTFNGVVKETKVITNHDNKQGRHNYYTISKFNLKSNEKKKDMSRTKVEESPAASLVKDAASNKEALRCNDPDLLPRREPLWEWHINTNTTVTKGSDNGLPKESSSSPANRLLIVQYSSYGNYARLLELTSPINKAYAKKWSFDFAILQGTTLLIPEIDEEGCEPPPHRAMYNKLEVLRVALSKKNEYDQLLIMDADAMVYDFSYDITSLIKSNKKDLLVAHRVREETSAPHTWNINNGITLWNLHHPDIQLVFDKWYSRTRKGVLYKLTHSDQHYLHGVLRNHDNGRLIKTVRSTSKEFKYGSGTVAKHFIRMVKDNREGQWTNSTKIRIGAREIAINETRDEICSTYPSDCEHLETAIYTM